MFSDTLKNILAVIIVIIIILCMYYEIGYVSDPSTRVYSNWIGTETHEGASVRATATIRLGKYLDANVNKRREMLFVGGTNDQDDVFMVYNDYTRALEVIGSLSKQPHVATMGVAVGDMTGNGYEDLVLARTDGVYIYYQQGACDQLEYNEDSRSFCGALSEFDLFSKVSKIYTANQRELLRSVSLGDINRDGNMEIFVGSYTKKAYFKPFQFCKEGTQRDHLFKKDVRGYIDIAHAMGVEGTRNTWTASFVDLSGNGYPDLVVATDEGPVDIFRNHNGDFFSRINLPFPVGFWMGMAVGDFCNNRCQSMFFTNSGDTIGPMMMRMMGADPANMPPGFTSKHLMIKNHGNYNFEIIKGNGLNGDKYNRTGFGWGAIAMDFDLDGNQDIIYSNNWKMIPWHRSQALRDNGTVLQNMGDGTFRRRQYFKNPHFSMTPIALDLNGNGVKDLAWINNNYNVVGYLNLVSPHNNWINVALPKTADYANATVFAKDTSGRVQSHQNILGGTGLCSSKSSIIQFGFGTETPVWIKVAGAIGAPSVINKPKLFKTYVIT